MGKLDITRQTDIIPTVCTVHESKATVNKTGPDLHRHDINMPRNTFQLLFMLHSNSSSRKYQRLALLNSYNFNTQKSQTTKKFGNIL